jgi:hypothetical protein
MNLPGEKKENHDMCQQDSQSWSGLKKSYLLKMKQEGKPCTFWKF